MLAIATGYRGIAEITVDGETGFLVDWRDPMRIAEKINELYRSPAMYAEMSIKARQRYHSLCAIDKHLDALQHSLGLGETDS